MIATVIRFVRSTSARMLIAGLAVVVLASIFVEPAAGTGLEVAGSVQPGEVIDNDLLLTGFEGVIDGTVIGNVFATGKEVTVNGEVQGSLFVLGDKITINGDVLGGAYVLAVSLEQGSNSSIGLNLYFLGVNLRSDPGAVIGRDLVMVALSANLAGEVGRDTRAIVGVLELLRLLGEGLSQSIRGKSISAVPTAIAASPASLARPYFLPASKDFAQQTISSDEVVDILLNCGRALVSFLIVGGLAIWLLPQMFHGSTAQLRTRPLASAGLGALVLVNGFLLSLLLAVVLLGVGLGLRALTLTALAWAFWGVTFSALGLAFSIFMISFVWLSKVIVATLVGVLVLERLYPKSLDYRGSALALGLLIYLLLCPIPVLGWVVALIVTVLGLGGMFLSIRQLKWSGGRGRRKK